MDRDITILLKVDDRPLAEEIQRILSEQGIYTALESDNPASSAMVMYAGNHVIETISMLVAVDTYPDAVKALEDTPYIEFLTPRE